MGYKINYRIVFLLAAVIFAAVVSTHEKSCVAVHFMPKTTCSYEQTSAKRINDMIDFISLYGEKSTIVENGKSSKAKPLFTLIGVNKNQNELCSTATKTKNQLSHFQADYPIRYYIFSLHEIIT